MQIVNLAMNRVLYLHIGTEKTGTTSLQDTLYKNKELLKTTGVHFLQSAGSRNNRALPSLCMDGKKRDAFLVSKGILDEAGRERFKAELYSKLCRELETLPAKIHTVIISSEHFHSRVNSRSEIEKLFSILSPYFSKIFIVCYLREQSELCASLYSTAIKAGGVRSFNEFLGTCRPDRIYYNYFKFVSLWASVFGLDNLIVRNYSRKCLYNKDIADDFFFRLGIDIDFVRSDLSKNSSLNVLGQAFLVAINKTMPKYHEDGALNEVRRSLVRAVDGQFKGRGQAISMDSYQKIYDSFNDGNVRLNEKLLGGEGNFFEFNPPAIYDNSTIIDDSVVASISSLFEVLEGGVLSSKSDI